MKFTTKTMIETMILDTVIVFSMGMSFLLIMPIIYYENLGIIYDIIKFLPIIFLSVLIVWSIKRIKYAEKIQKIIENNS